METRSLNAEGRGLVGKGPARRLRAEGWLPGILYGQGAEPTMLSVSPKDLKAALSSEYGRNVLIALKLDGHEHLTMVKELQVHPVSRGWLHVDFLMVDREKPVRVLVPLSATGRSKGVLAGGELNIVIREVPVLALPDRIPPRLECDITDLDIKDMLRVENLVLPEGVSVMLPPDRTLVVIAAERKEEEAPKEAEAELEGEEKPEGEGEGEEKPSEKEDTKTES